MKDCTYLDVINFNSNDTFSHKDNKDLICLLIHKFYENNSGASYALVYDCNTKRTEPNTNFSDENYTIHNKIISSFINKILKFEEDCVKRDRDEYLVELLYYTNYTILQNQKYSLEVLDVLFNELYLTDFLDDVSATFFKAKTRIFIEHRKSSTKS